MTRRSQGSPSTPLLTVGLPVFNGGVDFVRALDALAAQDLEDVAFLISDNASTDGSAAAAAAMAERDDRFRVLRQARNVGAAANFNVVLDAATSPYFAWAGHDDMWSPNHFRTLVAHLEAHPGVILAHPEERRLRRPDGTPSPQWGDLPATTTSQSPARRFANVADAIQHNSFVYGVWRREALPRSPFDGTVGEDILLSLRSAARGSFAAVPGCWFEYRVALDKTPDDYVRMLRPDGANLTGRHFSLLCREVHKIALSAPGPPFDRTAALIAATRLCGRKWALPVSEEWRLRRPFLVAKSLKNRLRPPRVQGRSA